MAQGIKKGFFFYFGLFVLFLATIFLICVVVMMFNPGKTVLWMKYFTDNGTPVEYVHFKDGEKFKTEDGNEFDWADVKSIKIDDPNGYANVTVSSVPDNSMLHSGLYVKNKSKGFAVAKNSPDFDVKLSFESGQLNVEVVEPQGFMYFSKSIDIELHGVDNFNFENLGLDISVDKGNVNIGDSGQYDHIISPSSLSVETNGGNINISDNFDMSKLTKCQLKTYSGNITSSKIADQNTKHTGISTNCNVVLETEKGEIKMGAILVETAPKPANEQTNTAPLTVSCKRGVFQVDKIVADEVYFSHCEQGNFIMGDVVGDLDFTGSGETLIAPNIRINSIDGSFVLVTNDNQNSKPDITIDEIQGNLNLIAKNGKVVVKEVAGEVYALSSDGLNIEVTLSATNNNPISILNEKGEITLNFVRAVSNDVTLRNNTGKINVNVTSDASFVAKFWKYVKDLNEESQQPEIEGDGLNKINVSIPGITKENPLEIGETYVDDQQVDVKIYSNGNIDLTLVNKDIFQ